MALDLPEFAPHPPCGWNSFDCFGSAVTEAEVLANAEVLARDFLPSGFDTVVVDYCWSHPAPGACHNPDQSPGYSPHLAMDLEHRLLPAPERFPSARDGKGFAPLAGKIHALGLKFGIHIMRGFPRQCLYPGFPAKTSRLLPSEIADPESTCTWLNHMCGVRPTPAGQAYYDSLFQLYASWGVDYVKADDLVSPYRAHEIEMLDLARRRCGRPITLSLSPGPCPIDMAPHVSRHSELWRLSADFWDRWADLRRAFRACREWERHRATGAWPDPDMLPIGRLSRRGPTGPERDSFLCPAEQRSLLALWSVFRAPLFIGGDLTVMDSNTHRLLTHPGLRLLREHGRGGHCLHLDEVGSVWTSPHLTDDGRHFVALFNLSDQTIDLPLPWTSLPVESPPKRIENLWTDEVVSPDPKGISVRLSPHDASILLVAT